MGVKEATRGGFTLIETLVALAVAALIVVSTSTLIHDGAFFFDRGTRAVDQTEQFALAIDSLTRDFGAARYVVQKGEGPQHAAFSGDEQGDITFITAGGRASGPQGEEIVGISVEQEDGVRELVRRRLPWLGPRMAMEGATLQDAVVLLKGPFDISFAYSQLTPSGEVAWSDHWSGEPELPHSVRMTLRDETTGADLVAGGEFFIRANAPMVCSSGKHECLSPMNAAPAVAASTGSQQQDQTR